MIFSVDGGNRANYLTRFPESQPGAGRRFIRHEQIRHCAS